MFKLQTDRINIYRKLFPYIRSDKKKFFYLGTFKIYYLILSLITPIFYGLLINEVMIERKIEILYWVISGYIIVYLLQTLGIVLEKRIYNQVFIKMDIKLKSNLFDRYTKIKEDTFSKYETGDLRVRIHNDVSLIEKFFHSHCLEYLFSLSSILVITIILFYLNWILATVAIIMVPISFLFSKVMAKRVRKDAMKYRQIYGESDTFINTSIQNWKEIKTSNLEKQKLMQFKIYWRRLSSLLQKLEIYATINRIFVAFKDLFITQMNLYFVGGLLIIAGQMDIGLLLVFMSYYAQLFNNVTSISDLIVSLKSDRAGIDRVIEILTIEYKEKPKVEIKDTSISLKNISYKYDDEQVMVLKDIDLEIKPREYVAIVGRSGSGKSTLAKLIIGLYQPRVGTVNIGGHVLQEISEKSIWKRVSIVMQEPQLFNLSIKENMQLVNRSATLQMIQDACQKANIHELIESLPDKYDTVIGEDGVKLSGGQKQRLAIARIILLNPEIIIFDEATSALDQESEKQVLNAIKNLSESKTIIAIAHRLSTIIESDRVILMDNGRIIDTDRHEKLFERNNLYNSLFSKQYIENSAT